jgi:hypothetical protein
MNFTTQVLINRSRQRVVELISNLDNLAEWQPGLTSVELLAGERNQVGARQRVIFEVRGFGLEMVETVTEYKPPEVFASIYVAKGVRNLVENRFFDDGPNTTRWVLSNRFTFSGMMSIAGIFLKDFVPQQASASMHRFKEFAERS